MLNPPKQETVMELVEDSNFAELHKLGLSVTDLLIYLGKKVTEMRYVADAYAAWLWSYAYDI